MEVPGLLRHFSRPKNLGLLQPRRRPVRRHQENFPAAMDVQDLVKIEPVQSERLISQ